jgi:hypothetical protein
MKAKTDHFQITSSTQDRIKPSGRFLGWTEVHRPHPGCRSSPKQPPAYGLHWGKLRHHGSKLLDLASHSRPVQRSHDRLEIHEPGRHRLVSPNPPRRPRDARTYRESIERLARYKQLCSAEEFRITPKGDEVLVEISWPFAGEEPPPALLIDAVFALVTELGRRGTKTRLNPKRIELTRPAERENRFEEYFGCGVKYRATRDALILRAADLELPFGTHNDELLQMLAPQFEHDLKERRTKESILGQVKWVLKRLLAGSRPDLLFMVAKELGMSERTLQRRITDEGFQETAQRNPS